MWSLSSPIERIEPSEFWKASKTLLIGGFVFFLAVILLTAWQSTVALAVYGGLILGGFAFLYLARDELRLLCALLVGFAAVVGYEEGFQPEEIVYGLLYMGYLTYWFVSRLFFYRDDILRTKVDWALFLFLIYATLSLVLTPILGGELPTAISQWLSLTMLAFYFPIKEICIRRQSQRPEKALLLSLGVVALFVVVRNFLMYRTGLTQAEYLWQIATGRVVMNEHVLMMAGLVSLLFLLYARRWVERSTLGILFILFSAGVIIGQSRALWVSFLLGIAVIFFFVDKRKRLAIVGLGVAGVAAVLIVGAVVFENFFSLILAGLLDRFFSLQGAATKDVSLINRFIEMDAAWQHIKVNPIVGHGLGVDFKYYSLVYEVTYVQSYIHNSPIATWYRHGLIGLILVAVFYFGTIWTAFRTARMPRVDRMSRLVAIAAAACLVAESLVGNMFNPLANSDTTLMIAVAMGLTASARHNTEQRAREP